MAIMILLTADSMETMLTQGDAAQFMAQLQQKDKTLWQKVKDWFKDLAGKLQKAMDAYKGASPDSAEGRLVAQMEDFIGVLQQAYGEALVDAAGNYRAAEGQKNTTGEGGDIRYMVRDGVLTENSTEQERYNYLKDAEITVAQVNEKAIKGVNLEEYNTRKKSAVTPGLVELANKLGILNVDLKNSKIEFPFQYSAGNLRKSIHHQLEYGGTYQDYVKAMSCFGKLIENAIPIEVHGEKKIGTARENKDLKRVYVLVSAYKDGNSIVPVQFEVKEFKERNNSLYMTVVLTKIDLEVVDTGVPGQPGNVPHLFSRSTVSLQYLFGNVNPQDGRFLKYVPDGFLDEAQKQAKAEALAKQKKEYEDYGPAKLSDRDPTATATVVELEKQNGKLWEDTYGTAPYMTQLQDWMTNEQTAEQTAQQSIEQAAEQTTEHTSPDPANTLDPDTEVTPGTATLPKTPEQTISEIADKIQKPGITSGKARIAAQQMYTEAEKYGPHRDIMLEAYNAGQDPKRFADGFQNAYISGTLGDQAALGNSKAAAYLTQEQREIAYELGSQAVSQRAKKENTNGGNTDLEAAGMSPPEKKGPQAGKPNLHSSGDDSTIEERREAFREAFLAGEISTRISPQKQARHIWGTKQFREYDVTMAVDGDHPSYIREDLSENDLSRLVVSKLRGVVRIVGNHYYEYVNCDEVIGYYYGKDNGGYTATKCAQVAYALGKKNIHIIPVREV